MTTLFWLSVVGVLYPYLLYPTALWMLGKIVRRPNAAPAPLPSVTLIIPVSNEEARIATKVANTAAQRYPAGRLQILTRWHYEQDFAPVFNRIVGGSGSRVSVSSMTVAKV